MCDDEVEDDGDDDDIAAAVDGMHNTTRFNINLINSINKIK